MTSKERAENLAEEIYKIDDCNTTSDFDATYRECAGIAKQYQEGKVFGQGEAISGYILGEQLVRLYKAGGLDV